MTGSPDGSEPALFGGRFQIGELLGAGGSAAVYRCQDFGQLDAHGRPTVVALKVLHPALSEKQELRAAFLREAARLAEVDQRNVAAVYASGIRDTGTTPRAWIALEAVEGPTLAEWVVEHGRLGPYQAASVMDGLLSGLQAAHDVGLVHRDIAPGNVILHAVGPDEVITAGAVRLVDFGLADAAGGTVVGDDVLLATGGSSTTTVVGNVEYLSPEQASGGSVGSASDLYQAGAVLHFLLTAQPPFHRATVAETVRARLTDPPPVPSALVPSVRRLDRVVVKALATNPQARFGTAEEFRQAVLAAVAVRPADGPTRVMETSWEGPSPATRQALAAEPSSSRPDAGPEAGSSLARLIGPVLIGALAIAVVAWIGLGMAGTGSLAALPMPTIATATPSSTPTPTPSPGKDIPRSSPAQVQVPSLYGDLASVQAALRAAGLEVGRVRIKDSAEPAGRVLGQSPAGGTSVALGDSVDVTLATGFNRIPPVAGMSVTAAQALLTTSGFNASSDANPTLVVAGTQPSAGTRLAVGDAVILVLNTEPTPVTTEPSPSPTPAS